MANQSQFLQEGKVLDYTPAVPVTAGKIIQVGSLSVFAPLAIAAAALGQVQMSGVIRSPFVGGIANMGDNIWWDADATPYGGAADGAFTHIAANGDWWVGTLARATALTDALADIALNRTNRELPAWPGKKHITTGADLVLTAADHSGGVIHVTPDAGPDTKITLPIGVVGMDFIIQYDGPDAGNLTQVDLNGNEIIEGMNLTIAATKLAVNTLATAKRGDYLHLVCNVAALSWRSVAKRGIWVTT